MEILKCFLLYIFFQANANNQPQHQHHKPTHTRYTLLIIPYLLFYLLFFVIMFHNCSSKTQPIHPQIYQTSYQLIKKDLKDKKNNTSTIYCPTYTTHISYLAYRLRTLLFHNNDTSFLEFKSLQSIKQAKSQTKSH
jgi:hypothetical protein